MTVEKNNAAEPFIEDSMKDLKSGNIDFCTVCRKWVPYKLQPGTGSITKDGKDYEFPMTEAVCTKCGALMSPLGLIDKNILEYADWFEATFGEKINRGNLKSC